MSSDIHAHVQELLQQMGQLQQEGRHQETIKLGRQLVKLIHDHNRLAWDSLVRLGQPLTSPANDEELRRPSEILDRDGWLGGDVRGRRVLCLSGGGGRQAVLYAAAGAIVYSGGPQPRDVRP